MTLFMTNAHFLFPPKNILGHEWEHPGEEIKPRVSREGRWPAQIPSIFSPQHSQAQNTAQVTPTTLQEVWPAFRV